MTAMDILREGTVIPALPLALNENRAHDERRQRALVRYYLQAGAGGVAAGVHTTQFELRGHGLLEPVLRIAKDEFSSHEQRTGKPVVKVAGVCGETADAVREAELAQKLGYDAVLLSPGGLDGRDEDYLLDRAARVAEIVPVIGFYLQSAVGGRRLGFDFWREFCEIKGVAALKSAPFDRYKTLDLVRGCAFSSRRGEIALYTGNDDSIVVDLLTPYVFTVDGERVEMRFAGGLLGHWSVWTATVVELFERLRSLQGAENIPSDMLTLAAQITDANGAFFDVNGGFRGCIAGIHEVLRRQGLLEGILCLNPAETLSPGQAEEIDRVCAAYPHLSDDAFVRGRLSEFLR